MAMIFIDGFDANDLSSKWDIFSTYTASTSLTRFGTGRSMNVNYTTSITKILPVASTKLFVGFGSYVTADSPVGSKLVTLYGDGGATQHIRLEIASANSLRVVRADGVVLATSTGGTHVSGAWEYIEFMATVADSGGRAVIRVNGVIVIDFTGDTRNGGTSATLDAMRFSRVGSNDGPMNYHIDDLYVLNDTGTVNNDFLGDVRVHTLPVTGAGADTQMAPTGSLTNWQNIDEFPAVTTDYNSSYTVGQRDTYSHQDIPATTSNIFSVQTNLTLGKTDAGNAYMKPVVRSGGAVYYDPTISLSSSAVLYSIPHDTDPATASAWTVSGVNNIETGAEVA